MKDYIVTIQYQATISSKNQKLALTTLVNKIVKGEVKSKATITQIGKL